MERNSLQNGEGNKAPFKVKAPAQGRAPGARAQGSSKKSVMSQVSLFERVPEEMRLSWPDIASILSGVVSSLSKLMGGGIVAFYAGCQLGGVAVAITFALSFVLTYLVGRVTFEEGLPNNVASRIYIFGTKGSALGSLVWIFLLVGVLAVGTVQLGNAIMFALGISDQALKVALFLGISCIWVLMALFGAKVIARMNAVFVVALFCVMGYVVYLVAASGQLADAATHGVMVPGVEPLQGFSYGVNYAVMTSGLLALFAADFTRFARKGADLVPISLVGSLFAIVTYIFGALITYYGFDAAYQYFLASGSYDATGAANAAITNPGISLVLASGGIGLAIICLSQMKVETSNSIGGANAVSNLFHSLFGVKLPWPVAVVIANAIGLVFIFGNILDQVNAFMSIGSILTIGWCVLLITDYYVVRGPMHIGRRHVPLEEVEPVNWRGVVTLVVVTTFGSWLYAAGIVPVPILVVAPTTFVLYVVLSWAFRKRIREKFDS